MEPIIIRTSMQKALISAALAAIMIAIGTWLATTRTGSGVLWVALESLGLVLFVWAFLDRRPKLILDDQGILDKRLRVGVIPWAEICSIDVRSLGGIDFVWLERCEMGRGDRTCKPLPLRADDLEVSAPVLGRLEVPSNSV
jgi:hypothetical protein